jgi:hypothetical protein
MIRVLTFDGEKGARRFALAHQGFLAGGNASQGQTAVDRATLRQRARILRAFKALAQDPEALPLVLNGGDGVLRLEQPELALLEKYVEATPWTVHIAEDVDDLLDFLSAAAKEE